jgi:hypothetical protein
LPEEIPVDDKLGSKLDAFVARGGKIIASHESGLDQNNNFWAGFGAEYKGHAPFSPDFIVPDGALKKGLPGAEYVMYEQGALVEPAGGTSVLSWVNTPYFNRAWEHYCSHQHTPSSGKKGYPGVIQNGNVIYFIHPIFSQYDINTPLWCKTLVSNAIDAIMPRRLVRHDGPSSMLVTLNMQRDKNRRILHALHYIPERRGRRIDVIEDTIPLHDVKFDLTLDEKVKSVKLAPEMLDLDFQQSDGILVFTIPVIRGHQMVEIV